MKYYRVFDKQTGNYLATGCNCTTKEDVFNDLKEWDGCDGEKIPSHITLEDFINYKELVLEEQNEPFEEENY